jgi:membrane-bound lytic murein transglycosylase F
MKRHFSDIPEPDRTFFALAAYNIGRAHVLDAQRLARRKGLNPYHWRDVREMLPLLSKPEYYRTLRYGHARGGQPVSYVRRIREYHHVLASRIQ